MNIGSELEKLVSLRNRGDLSQPEFEKAKARLLSEGQTEIRSDQERVPDSIRSPKAIPGLGLAAGVFIGNLLFISIASGDVLRGFIVGAIAGALVILISLVVRALKSN